MTTTGKITRKLKNPRQRLIPNREGGLNLTKLRRLFIVLMVCLFVSPAVRASDLLDAQNNLDRAKLDLKIIKLESKIDLTWSKLEVTRVKIWTKTERKITELEYKVYLKDAQERFKIEKKFSGADGAEKDAQYDIMDIKMHSEWAKYEAKVDSLIAKAEADVRKAEAKCAATDKKISSEIELLKY
ncbi:MAG: hypothetical protein FWH04_05540 [Oscillospiraceae bacterium]|nr:hypothetical protein [Oscillospiraceae bacterium]